MITAQVVETSVGVNNNSPIQDYVHPDDQTQPTFINKRRAHIWQLITSCILSYRRKNINTWKGERI